MEVGGGRSRRLLRLVARGEDWGWGWLGEGGGDGSWGWCECFGTGTREKKGTGKIETRALECR